MILHTENTTKKMILQNFVDCNTIQNAIEDKEDILLQLRKQNNNESLIKQHEEELISLKQKMDEAPHNVDKDTTEDELSRYEQFCNAFETMVQSEEANRILRTKTGESTEEALFYVGVFNYLKSRFDIPVIVVNNVNWYFYPQYIIKAKSPFDFDIISYSNVFFSHREHRQTQELWKVPKDTHYDNTWWLHETKNGERDRRYSNNIQYCSAYYMRLTMFVRNGEELVEYATWQFSNAKSVKRFVDCTRPRGKFNVQENSSKETLDNLFEECARLVVASQFGSVSLLQRKLQLGYNRANRIMDQLEATGIVGANNGIKARLVLIKDELALEEKLNQLRETDFCIEEKEDIPMPSPVQQNSTNYNLVKEAANNLYQHILLMNENNEVIKALNQYPQFEACDSIGYIKGINKRLGYLVLFTIFKSYRKLGHSTIKGTEEGVYLGIIISLILNSKISENETLLRSTESQDTLQEFYDAFNQTYEIKSDSDNVILIDILRAAQIDTDIVDRFAVLLYRYLHYIAISDNTITLNERKWLNNLLSATQQKDIHFDIEEKKAYTNSMILQVANFVVEEQSAVPSSIMSKFGINYAQALSILERLETAGIVEPLDANEEYSFRKVLVEKEADLKALLQISSDEAVAFTFNVEENQPPIEHKKIRSKQLNKNPLKELENLIGLSSVKKDVSDIYKLIATQQARKEKGLKVPEMTYHCVFTGNPGTGKTTVARIVAQIYKELGIIKKGHLVETDRSGLVAEYVGQTAVKTNKLIDSALDGVLFIDEAYSLVQGYENDFGKEAISTLLKRMEDDRDRLIVILAGYSDEMKQFIDSNPGLQSRFNRYIHFDDYEVADLVSIFQFNLKKNDYFLTDEALAKLTSTLEEAVAHKDKNFGNARFVRNLFEKTITNQAVRMFSESTSDERALQEIQPCDIP